MTKASTRGKPARARKRAPPTGDRVYGGATGDQRRAGRRERFIAAGVEVFGTHGFQGATVRQICAAAGLTERYFYESFASQQALFTAVYDEQLDRLTATLTKAWSGTASDAESMLRAVIGAYFGVLQREPRMARILLIEIYATVQDVNRLYQRGVVQFAELFRGLIERDFHVEASGELDADLLATAAVGASIHLATRWYLGGYRETRDSMIANSLAIVTAVLGKLARVPTTSGGIREDSKIRPRRI